MDFDKAKALANEFFYDRHDRQELPPWFVKAVTIGGRKSGKDQWVISYFLNPTSPIEGNQKWEEILGEKVVVETDPITGKRSILISRAGPEPIVVFEVSVGLGLRTGEVRIDTNLAELDGNDFENYD